jgi:hypothetical protein
MVWLPDRYTKETKARSEYSRERLARSYPICGDRRMRKQQRLLAGRVKLN